MFGSRRSTRMRRVVGRVVPVAALTGLLSLAGCGSDGSSGIDVRPGDTPQANITGIVYGPGGAIAMHKAWWDVGLVSSAFALLPGVTLPVGPGQPVSLSQVDIVDAGDGVIDHDQPLIPLTFTNFEGRYSIIAPEAEDVTSCRKMVSVGSGTALTRSFVYRKSPVDIDATSEAMVRVILDNVAQTRHQLCNFSSDELIQIYDKVFVAASTARGDNVADLNQAAYVRARGNRDVQAALAAAGESAN